MTKEAQELAKKWLSELPDEPIDWFNIQDRINDIWLFLTSDKMPSKASIKKEAFDHEVKAMLQGLLFAHCKQECIEFVQWLTKEDSPYAVLYGNQKERFATNENDYTIEQLYELYLLQSKTK